MRRRTGHTAAALARHALPTIRTTPRSQYTWIFGLSCVVSFICAFGIGANDVANSFASSVGAKALTMPQAILVAAVCEFSGAVLMGSGVTDTIKGSIASLATFKRTPDLFLYGFFCVMLAAAFWDNLSCHLSASAAAGAGGWVWWRRRA